MQNIPTLSQMSKNWEWFWKYDHLRIKETHPHIPKCNRRNRIAATLNSEGEGMGEAQQAHSNEFQPSPV